MKRTLKIPLGIAGTILGLFLLIIIGLNIYYRINYMDFYAFSERQFRISGLNEGFIPQGLTFRDGTFLTCGYMKDGSASRIYIINGKGTYVKLLTEHGTADTNHAGGLAIYGDYLYLTNEDSIGVYRLNDILNASAGDTTAPVYQFQVGLQSAFVYVKNNRMFVGEFYRKENYSTDETHHMKTDAGDMHHAIMAVFTLSKGAEYGFVSKTPEYVYSIPDLAQGICITESGRICVSTSYGIADSHICIYEDPARYSADVKFEYDGKQVPLFYLDSNHLEKDEKLFPMSEELFYENGKIYVMCESASNKYIFGKFTGNDYVYSFPAK